MIEQKGFTQKRFNDQKAKDTLETYSAEIQYIVSIKIDGIKAKDNYEARKIAKELAQNEENKLIEKQHKDVSIYNVRCI